MKNRRKKKINTLLMLISFTIIFSLSIGAAAADESSGTPPDQTSQTSQITEGVENSTDSQNQETGQQSTETQIPDPYNTRTGVSYTTIQAAINDPLTLDGDTIWVQPGTYRENVILNKRLTLIPWPEMPGTVTVQASTPATPNNPVITIRRDNSTRDGSDSTIQGLTIRGATGTTGYGIYLNNVNGCTITGNTITGNRYGIYVNGGTGNTISGNTITGNTINGIYIQNSSPAITGNSISNNGGATGSGYDGIYINGGSPTISGNTIRGNRRNGIYTQMDSPTISGNTISNNGVTNTNALTGNGIYVASGNPIITVNTIESNGNPSNGNANAANGIYVANGNAQIQNNPLINGNGHDGIHVAGGTSSIQNNPSINNNRQRGIHVAGGTPTINNNSIIGNWWEGVRVENGTFSITNNNISNNGNNNGATTKYNGVYVYNGAPTITGNTINNNLLNGIYIRAGAPDIKGDTINGNYQDGIHVASGTFTIGGSNPSDRNIITNNRQRGIEAAGGTPTVTGNAITGNWWQGIYVNTGIFTINNNDISNNGNNNGAATKYDGIYIYNGSIIINGNTISSNRLNGVYVRAGVHIVRDNTISSNGVSNIVQNSGNGIYVANGGTTGNPIQITGNTITGNGNPINNSDNMANGIYVANGVLIIEGNPSIDGNRRDGVHVAGGTVIIGSSTASNTISGNSQQGIHITGGTVTVTNNNINSNLRNGIYAQTVSPTITDNTIRDNGVSNTTALTGNGIYVGSGNPTISDNTIENNGNAANTNTNAANGIYVNGGNSAIWNNPSITGNRRNGIYVNGGNPNISGNTISGNGVTNNNQNSGNGVYVFAGSPTISGNTIIGNGNPSNSNENMANGIYIYNTSPRITSNTIMNNRRDGIHSRQGSQIIDFNRIVGNALYGLHKDNTGTVNAKYNWWGTNTPTTGVSPAPRDIYQQSGTINYDPWMILTTTASPSSINNGGSSTITVDLLHDRTGATPTGGRVPDGIPVIFTLNPNWGSIPASSTINNGITTVTFTANGGKVPAVNPVQISATVDRETRSAAVTINPVVNLIVDKTGSATATAGLEHGLEYTIKIINTGLDDAASVILSDTVPSILTGVQYFNGLIWNDWTGSVTLGTIEPGSSNSKTVLIRGTVPSSTAAGTLITNPMATATTTTVPGHFDSSSWTTTVVIQSTLSMVKSGLSEVTAGLTYTDPIYTITITNTGPSDARNVQVTDILPVEIVNREYRINGGSWTSFTGSLDQIIAYIARDASSVIDICGSIPSSIRADSMSNTASASVYGNTFDSNTINTNIIKSADVDLTKTVDNARPDINDYVTFTVTARNNGPSDAIGVQIRDMMPSDFTDVTVTPSKGTYTGGVWTVDLLSSEEATLTFKGKVTSAMAGKITTNTATKINQTEQDLDSSDSASVSIYVPKSDLYIQTTESNNNPFVGQNVVITAKLGNNGPDNANGVTVTYVIPNGLEFVSVNADQGTIEYNSATRALIWNVGEVKVGDPYLYITVRASNAGIFTLTPVINSITYNADSGSTETTINAQAQPTPVKVAGIPVVNAQQVTAPVTTDVTPYSYGTSPVAAPGNLNSYWWVLLVSVLVGGIFRLFRRRNKGE